MDIYLEFIGNNILLFIALLVILLLLSQSIFSDLTRKHKLLSAPEAIDLINKKNAVIIDTRTKSEFDAGHIADAVLLPLPDIQSKPDTLNKYSDQPVLFYCKSGPRADDACKKLLKQGHGHVFALRGGLQAWQEANMPLIKK